MSAIITPDPKPTVWFDQRTWGDPTHRLEQKLERVAVGTPETPADTGGRAVDEYSEDLRRLADS